MEINNTANSTIITIPSTILTLAEVTGNSDVLKLFINSEHPFDIYILSDKIEKTGTATCIHSSKEKGFILLLKTDLYEKLAIIRTCIEFIKSLPHVQKPTSLRKRKTA